MAPAISSPRERSPRRAQHLRFERSIGSSWRGIPIQKSFLRFLDARVSSRHNNLCHGINTWKGWQPTASNDGTRRFVRLTSRLGPYPTMGRQWLSSSASKALKQIHHPEIGTGRGTSTNSCRGGPLWGNIANGSKAPILACPQHVRQDNLGNAGCPVLPVEGIGLDVIQAPKRSLDSCSMNSRLLSGGLPLAAFLRDAHKRALLRR